MESLIPGLPDDVAKLCIARVPLKEHAALHAVCRSWKSWLTEGNEELAKMRQDAGLLSDQLFLLVCKSIFSNTRLASEQNEAYSHLPWLWNGRRYVKHSYRLTKVGSLQKGVVMMEPVGEEFACKLPFPYAKAYETMVATGQYIFLFQIGRDVWRCDTSNGKWQQVATRNSFEKKFAWGWIKGQLYIAGGQSHTDGGTTLSAEVYNPEKDLWSRLPPMPQVRGKSQGYVTIDGKLLVLGTDGRGIIEPAALVYDPDKTTGNGWSVVENMWPYGGRLVASAAAGRQMFVVSEHGRGNFELRQYNGKAWRLLECRGIENVMDGCNALVAINGGLLSATGEGSSRWLRPPRSGSLSQKDRNAGICKQTMSWIQGNEEIIVAGVHA